jgi:hypothetical protein
MKLTELFLAELERESVLSRRTLERVPDGRYHWKPQPKSMPMVSRPSLVSTRGGSSPLKSSDGRQVAGGLRALGRRGRAGVAAARSPAAAAPRQENARIPGKSR